MQVYGTSCNLKLYECYVQARMEEAHFAYEKALSFVKVYLGDIFREDSQQAKRGEIFVPDIDEYRKKFKGNAGHKLEKDFFKKLGKVVRDFYLPAGCKQWADIEILLARKLDHTLQQLPGRGMYTSQAFEVAADLFVAALLGQSVLELRLGTKTERISLNYHLWRHWFYRLWGQDYEWGSITIDKAAIEANGLIYSFAAAPQRADSNNLVLSCRLLEAHGFSVIIHPEKKVEYWR